MGLLQRSLRISKQGAGRVSHQRRGLLRGSSLDVAGRALETVADQRGRQLGSPCAGRNHRSRSGLANCGLCPTITLRKAARLAEDTRKPIEDVAPYLNALVERVSPEEQDIIGMIVGGVADRSKD